MPKKQTFALLRIPKDKRMNFFEGSIFWKNTNVCAKNTYFERSKSREEKDPQVCVVFSQFYIPDYDILWLAGFTGSVCGCF
ncbi:hypothetical protein J25TS5_47930 [Paenibacillus faecis]|nr:hypothetical protein J25TS5_47930 [Paenibacillus faecis]